MASLTGIISTSGGYSLGSIVPLRSENFGYSANIGTQQFVRTGYLVPYTSRHAPLITQTKSYGVAVGSVLPNNWIAVTGSYTRAIRYANTYYHIIEGLTRGGSWGSPSQNVRFGTSLTANATGGNTGLNQASVQGIGDSIEFNNGINVIGYTFTGGSSPYGMVIFRSNTASTGYTVVYNPGTKPHGGAFGLQLVSSGSLIVAYPNWVYSSSLAYGTDVATSTDGVTWTGRYITLNGSSTWSDVSTACFIQRAVWSPPANAFIILTQGGSVANIYTTTDGYTFTSRTEPVGYSTPVSPVGGTDSAFATNTMSVSASSNTATLISLSGAKILRVTGLTDYSILDFAQSGYTGIFSLLYDGTRFYKIPWNNGGLAYTCAQVSADDGLTWTDDFTFSGVHVPVSGTIRSYAVINPTVLGLSKANNRYFMSVTATVQEGPVFDITSKLGSSTPDYVGIPAGLAWATGSSLIPYVRVA